MTLVDDPRLALAVGGRSVGENLQRAVNRGSVIEREDGTLSLAARGGQRAPELFTHRVGRFRPPCDFLNSFLFTQAYDKAAVPFGCRTCFKVKAAPRTLRGLMALDAIAADLPETSKCGIEADNPRSPHVYASYFYNDGLEAARSLYRQLRERIDADAALGPDVPLIIKRGCMNYERHCGPSNQYTFDPRLAEVEAYLYSRFRRPPASAGQRESPVRVAERRMAMIRTAFRLGDESYKDFTDGKDLLPPVVTYAPDGPAPSPESDPRAREGAGIEGRDAAASVWSDGEATSPYTD